MKKEQGYVDYLFCFQGKNTNTLSILMTFDTGQRIWRKR